MSGKVPSRVRITRTQRNTPKYAGNMNQEDLMSCGFGRNRVICQKIKSRTAAPAALVAAAGPFDSLTDLNFFKAIDYWLAGGTAQAQVVSALGAIGSWNTNAVTSMNSAFKNGRSNVFGTTNDTTGFNEDISSWDVTSVLTFESMFEGATAFNQSLTWTMGPTLNSLAYMFKNATAFNGTLNWAQNSGTTAINCTQMFFGATNFTGLGLPNWQGTDLVRRLGNLDSMFKNATVFNQDLSSWRFAGIAFESQNMSENDLNSIFEGATALSYTLGASLVVMVYAGKGTATDLSWKDVADFVYGLRVVAGVGSIPNFYQNGNDYDGSASTATQFPKIMSVINQTYTSIGSYSPYSSFNGGSNSADGTIFVPSKVHAALFPTLGGANGKFSPSGQAATKNGGVAGGCGTITAALTYISAIYTTGQFDGWQLKITSVVSTNTGQPTSAFLGLYDIGGVNYSGGGFPDFFAFTGKSDLNGNCGAATDPANTYWPWNVSDGLNSYPQQVNRNSTSGGADVYGVTVQFLKGGIPIQLD